MKSVQESKKVLVCLPQNITLDNYASAYLICKSLKDDLGKEVDIASQKDISQRFTAVLPLNEFKTIKNLPPKKFLIEFRNQKSKIKNIQWSQEGDMLNFFVSMEQGNFNPQNMFSKIIGAGYESIILIGINSMQELGEIFSANKEAFTDANVISIGGQVKESGINVDLQIDEKHTSVSEDTYIFLQKLGAKIEGKRSSALLAGIFSATKNFKKNIVDPKTYIICAELIRRGGSNEEAQQIIEQTKPKDQSQQPKQSSGNQQTQGNNNNSNNNSQNTAQRYGSGANLQNAPKQVDNNAK